MASTNEGLKGFKWLKRCFTIRDINTIRPSPIRQLTPNEEYALLEERMVAYNNTNPMQYRAANVTRYPEESLIPQRHHVMHPNGQIALGVVDD